ncbi:MAG: hypothetical protein Kow0031_30960 [Anaerolineae bacterium]
MSHNSSPVPFWQLFQKLDAAIDQDVPLKARLQNVNSALLDALEFEAIWCVTLPPLARLGCGVVRTPLSLDRQAAVRLTDEQPQSETMSTAGETVLGQVFGSKEPAICAPGRPLMPPLDADMGDALFGSFDVTIVAALPLVANDTVWGGLVLGCRCETEPDIPTQTHHLLAYLANYLGRALQHLYMQTSTGRYASTMRTLNHIGRTITSRLDIDEVIHQTMAGINAVLDVEAGSLLLLDDATGELYFKITLRGENSQITSYRLAPGEGIAGWVVSNNQAAIVNSPRSDPRFSGKIDRAIGFKTNSVLCSPLLVQGRPIGVLELVNKRGGAFSAADLELLEAMSASLGVALNNAVLYDRARERARQGELINQVSAAINAGHGFSTAARSIYRQLCPLIQCDHLSFSMVDKVSGTVRQWRFDRDGSEEQKQHTIPFARSRLAGQITEDRPFLEDDISTRPTFPEDRILVNDGVRSVLGVLLRTGASPYGCLHLGSRQAGFFSQKHLQLMTQLAPHLAVVLEKALLLDEMEQRTQELHQLNRLIEMLVSITDFQAITETVVKTLPRLLPSDLHGVLLLSEAGLHLALSAPVHFPQAEQIKRLMLDRLREFGLEDLPSTLQSEKLVNNGEPAPADWQPLASISLPILTRQGTVGLIYAATNQQERMGQEFLHLFSLVASQISAAVENAWLFYQVERERARLAAILASSTDAVLVVDCSGRIVLDNPAALDVLGAAESQRGRLLEQSTDVKPLVSLFRRAIGGDTTPDEILLPDGRTFFANLSPVVITHGDAIGWVATMQDVSHFKELNQLKNEFVNTVSHDLRSPLSGILIATNLVKEAGPVTGDQKNLLDMVERRVLGMSELIDDLLDVGRIEAGIDIDLRPSELAPLVVETVDAVRPLAESKQVELELSVGAQLKPVLANAGRLRQAVYNLVSNGVKYTPPQGRVLVKLFAHDREIRLQVIDSGIGIPAADQPHIFEKFYRVRGEHAMEVRGSGLGLAIVKSVVEKHHGRIWLESVFGEGSTFTMALPVAPQAEPEAI